MELRKKIDLRKLLGSSIRKRRFELGLSQEQLAEQVNVHRNYVGKVERGEQNITIDSLIRFANTFNCKPSDLLAEAGI